MTVWLTDAPEAAVPFVVGSPEWSPCPREESDVLAALASVFNPNRPTWISRCADARSGADRVIVLIDTAERSQFDAMLEIARAPLILPERLICLALTGSRFRGQRSRPWSAQRGNLHLTARYAINRPAATVQAAITMIPAIASAEAIASVSAGSINPRIKWVNDVFVAGKKVSGVLSATQVRGDGLESAIFGIGMNIGVKPDIQPTPFVPEAGCLAGFDGSLTDALPSVFHEVVRLLDEGVDEMMHQPSSSLFARYRARAGFIGERVLIWPEGTEDTSVEPLHRGRVVDMNPDLSLVLEGRLEPVRSGRLAYDR
jgi:biotin-(acetyl-CoA carboxylase) ligase